MAAFSSGEVILKAEEPKYIKVPNFSRLRAGYVEEGFYLQDAALKTIVVRVYPCGLKKSETKNYVCVVFKKLWIRHFPLNFHCTVSILNVYGQRIYSQTCGMEGLEQDFEIQEFVKRSTLFENCAELLPNDTLTVLCEVSYTMPSSQKSSKVWSVVSRLYEWVKPKTDNFCENNKTGDMCQLVVETMDGGEFLLPTPLSFFKVETKWITESSEGELCESIQGDENCEILASASLRSSGKDSNTQSQISFKTSGALTLSSCNSMQAGSLEKNSTICGKKDLTSLISGDNAASGNRDMPGLISAVTMLLSNKNLLSENTNTKESIDLCTSDSKEKISSAGSANTSLETEYKNKRISETSDISNDLIPGIKKGTSNTRAKLKRSKSKPEAAVAPNNKVLDLGSRKTVQGSDVCSASPVFTCMLKTPMLENSNKRIKLRNIDTNTFDNFLYYLEAHEIIAETFEELCDLYEMADQYEVMELMNDCSLRLFQSLDVQNFLIVQQLADMHSDDKLKKKMIKFFLQNEKNIFIFLQNDPAFQKWYDSWKKEDIPSNIEESDDEIDVCDNDLNFYR